MSLPDKILHVHEPFSIVFSYSCIVYLARASSIVWVLTIYSKNEHNLFIKTMILFLESENLFGFNPPKEASHQCYKNNIINRKNKLSERGSMHR